MTAELLEQLVIRARDLTYGMQERTKRLPDYADFRAAFKEVIDEQTRNITAWPPAGLASFQNGDR
jgi:hypothetical protein